MNITLAQLRDLAPWHFDIALDCGLRTADGNSALTDLYPVINPQELRPLLQTLYPQGLAGKCFLDVGCNGGGYSFLAHELGAAAVLGFDVRGHWMSQAHFLLQHTPSAQKTVRFEQWDLLQADTLLGQQQFDICLYKGIFYHVPDPVHCLQQIANRTRELLILDTDTAANQPDGFLKLLIEGVENPKSGVHRLAWLPTGPTVLRDILQWLGFRDTRLIYWRQPAVRQRGRIRLVAARNATLLDALADAASTQS